MATLPVPPSSPPSSRTTITEALPKPFQPKTITFPTEVKDAINTWLYKNIESRKKRLSNLHENIIPEWRRIIDGKPREENKSWPFPNCSNLVHPLIGEANDDLAARVMQLISQTSPIIYYRYLQTVKETEKAHYNAQKARTLEQFMDYVYWDPHELDLYPKENKWFIESAGLGKAYVCVAPEHRVEAVYVGYDEKRKGTEFDDTELYSGPKVVNLRYEDVLADPDVDVFEENDPLPRRVTLKKRQLKERTFKGFYLPDEVEKIIGHPDRYGNTPVRNRENIKKGITDTQDDTMAEWDIYETYFSWYHNEKKYRLIAWYHMRTKTMLNCVYNFIPHNQIPILETTISATKMGFAEMLRYFQDEVSTAKNQRNDAITFGMLGINRISTQNRNIDRNFVVFPGINLPFNEGEFEHYNVADSAMSGLSLQNEQAMIQQAKERAGVDPPIGGSGAGAMVKKGQYGSQGTMSVLQDRNSRTAHRQSDFRHSHVKLCGLLTDMYDMLGLGSKGDLFGLDEKLLTEALSDYRSRKLKIPIRAATASVNKEVTKSNQIILKQAIDAYIDRASKMYQASLDPKAPPEYRKWMQSAVKAMTYLMQMTVRDWQLSDQPQEIIPDIEFPQEDPNAQTPPNAAAAQRGPAGILEMAKIFQQRGAGGNTPGVPGVGGPPSGLPGAGGLPGA